MFRIWLLIYWYHSDLQHLAISTLGCLLVRCGTIRGAMLALHSYGLASYDVLWNRT